MLKPDEIKKLIDAAQEHQENTKQLLGKEIYQKRFKPVFEGYLTALCTVLEMQEDEKTGVIRNIKDTEEK